MVDISSTRKYPAGALSNFNAYAFTIDGVHCASMEGFLQSLKFEEAAEQAEVCQLVGRAAKKRGRAVNAQWQERQSLFWQGVEYPRDSMEYQELLDHAYYQLSKNRGFRAALRTTGKKPLTHSMGERDPRKTVLTESEMCMRLVRLRKRLLKG